MSILRDYIAYAKEHIHPKLSDEASQKLIQAYVDMRKIGSGRGQISAYPRQLESLIRLSEAHAKVRFSQVVEVGDVEEAYRYVNQFTYIGQFESSPKYMFVTIKYCMWVIKTLIVILSVLPFLKSVYWNDLKLGSLKNI